MKIVRNSLILLLDSGLVVSSLKTTHFVLCGWKKSPIDVFNFSLFIKTDKILNKVLRRAEKINLKRPQERTGAAEKCKSAFGYIISFILHWS